MADGASTSSLDASHSSTLLPQKASRGCLAVTFSGVVGVVRSLLSSNVTVTLFARPDREHLRGAGRHVPLPRCQGRGWSRTHLAVHQRLVGAPDHEPEKQVLPELSVDARGERGACSSRSRRG
jgi:hypothetical protein